MFVNVFIRFKVEVKTNFSSSTFDQVLLSQLTKTPKTEGSKLKPRVQKTPGALSAGSTLWQTMVAWPCLQILRADPHGAAAVTSERRWPCWAAGLSLPECERAVGNLYRTEAQPRNLSPGSPSGLLTLPACIPWESTTMFYVHGTQPVFTTTKKARTGLAWYEDRTEILALVAKVELKPRILNLSLPSAWSAAPRHRDTWQWLGTRLRV